MICEGLPENGRAKKEMSTATYFHWKIVQVIIQRQNGHGVCHGRFIIGLFMWQNLAELYHENHQSWIEE